MSVFKLLAIRPTKNCDKRFLKILKTEKTYSFSNELDFTNYNEKNRQVEKKAVHLPDLYSYYQSENKKIDINISAIVGENGSGKSSLVELFYAACYNLSIINSILRDEENSNILLNEKDLLKNINVELFFELNTKTVLLKLNKNIVTFFTYEKGFFKENNKIKFNAHNFFYTIAINYSLHSLNSNTLGIWVKKIFHKNDGYQTPIVLNPFRSEGNIDVNIEEYLIKSRLITNILGKVDKNRKSENSLRNILNKKIAYKLHVKLNIDKFTVDKKNKGDFSKTKMYGNNILPYVYKYFLNNKDFQPKSTILNKYAQEYIIYKLQSIAEKYDPYRRLFRFFYEEDGQSETYIKMLSQDKSHVTFKLIQAINFLTNDIYFNRKASFSLTIPYLSKKLENESVLKNRELIDILPPAFFDVDIEFKTGEFFNQLSSGEKQKIYSISTLIYHLRNLDSTDEKIVIHKYNNVNIIFDELELYFHPEIQRTLINDILENIKKISFKNIESINILFITHSPFILSDIPSNNILVIDSNGVPKNDGLKIETFGANIFDLLKHNFFLENGPMGDFAKTKINNTIVWLNNTKRNMNECNYHKSIISMIGEPILQIKLSEMYDSITQSKTEIDLIKKKIVDLQKLLDKKTN